MNETDASFDFKQSIAAALKGQGALLEKLDSYLNQLIKDRSNQGYSRFESLNVVNPGDVTIEKIPGSSTFSLANYDVSEIFSKVEMVQIDVLLAPGVTTFANNQFRLFKDGRTGGAEIFYPVFSHDINAASGQYLATRYQFFGDWKKVQYLNTATNLPILATGALTVTFFQR